MSQFDVIARLQLNAEQFSSGVGKAAAEVTGKMTRAAADIRQPFVTTFAEVERLGQTALRMPRNVGGSLDLSAEIAQLTRAADEAEQHAIALRELSLAQLAAAGSGRVDAQALQLEADASAVASLAAEREAGAHRDRIAVLGAVQRELNTTTSATIIHANAGKDVVKSAGAQRAGMQQLGFQLNDIATSWQGNIPLMTIFAQQGSQVIQSISLMAGEAKGLIGFLGGPWGAVITAATVVLTPMVMKLFETAENSKEAKAASDDLAKSVGSLGTYFDLTTGKIRETNRSLVQYAVLSRQRTNDDLRKAQEAAKAAGNAALLQSTSVQPRARRGQVGAGGVNFGAVDFEPGQNDVRSVFAEGTNIDARLRVLATSNSSNAALAAKILEQRAAFADSARKIAANDKEIRSLLSGTLDPSLRTGTDRATPPGGGRTPRTARVGGIASDLDAEAAATKAADKAQRALDTGLASLISRYDPATAAANRYAEALASIQKYSSLPAGNADRLSGDRAGFLRNAAQAEYLKSVQPELFARENDGGWLKRQNEQAEEAARTFVQKQDDAQRAAEERFHSLGQFYFDAMSGRSGDIWRGFERDGMTAIAKLAAQWTQKVFKKGTLKDLQEGAQYGAAAGSVFSQITGGKNDPLASSIGGAIGEKAGKALTKPLGDIFGKTIGGFAGPLGGIVGGILGNVVGGLFNSPKWSTSTVSLNATGTATGNKGSGTSGEAIAAATGVASSVASGINAIAEQLGATIKSLPALTLGTFDSKYRVATTSTTKSLNFNNFNDSVLKDFGSDQQAAIEYAVRYSISKAVVTGISRASQTILASGQDLQSAITKALLIEAIPRDLKAALDPVGGAIDALNLKWQKTVNALEEGGATTEQMAQAQQLYALQMDKVKNSTDSASQSLKDFMTGLKVGSGSAYSLRDQEATALAKLQPFLDQISAGRSIDQSKYQDAAKSFLDVERQLLGSTEGYFDKVDMIQAATNTAIAAIDNAVPISAPVANPFVEATAKNTATANQIAADTNMLLQETVAQNDRILATLRSMGGGGFVGGQRAF